MRVTLTNIYHIVTELMITAVVTSEAGIMVGHVDVPGKAVGGEKPARRVTAAHDWLTYSPIATLPTGTHSRQQIQVNR